MALLRGELAAAGSSAGSSAGELRCSTDACPTPAPRFAAGQALPSGSPRLAATPLSAAAMLVWELLALFVPSTAPYQRRALQAVRISRDAKA